MTNDYESSYKIYPIILGSSCARDQPGRGQAPQVLVHPADQGGGPKGQHVYFCKVNLITLVPSGAGVVCHIIIHSFHHH